jgi:hypothetical protein
MDKFLKFVEELDSFSIDRRAGLLNHFVQVWASPMVLNEIVKAAVGVGVGVHDLGTSALLFPLPDEEEEEEAWPPF